MKREIVGIFVITLLITTALPAVGAMNIQNIERKEQPDNSSALCTYIKETYMVPTRDGIKLATDVYLPSEEYLPQGAILLRTPYGKDEYSTQAEQWVDEGWVAVLQDARGRYDSEGEFNSVLTDNTDGADTSAWIASQDWSNGKVATWGRSARANCQYAMAGENPPDLTCQFMYQGSTDQHRDMFFQGGELRKNFIVGMLESMEEAQIIPEFLEHENFTLDYWKNGTLDDNWQDVHVPAIHVGGWYDVFIQGTIDGFMGYQYQGGDGAKGNSKLIIGPWVHARSDKTKQGELTYPENSTDTFSDEMFKDMINTFTMDGTGDGDFDKWPTVSYYVMGDVDDPEAPGNKWKYTDEWPVSSTEKSFYFHENEVLNEDEPGNYEPITYSYDPTDPVPTRGGQNIWGLGLKTGPCDQVSIENRDDVLVFTSPVLTEPVGATGRIEARLFVSSDCVDTDFTVKLTDVYPDGRSMLITDGILRMRNRNSRDHWEFIEPGEIYEVEVDLWSTSYIWNTGHKIRVTVSSSNSPRFLANPNTVDSIFQAYYNPIVKVAQNTLYIDGGHPSSLILPTVEVKGKTLDDKVTNAPLLNFLETYPNLFPIIRQLLQKLYTFSFFL